MKKVKRNPQKFETFELFSILVEELGYNISDDDVVNKVCETIKEKIGDSAKNDAMLYGKRNEGLFSYIVRGLNKVKLIKQEDAGDAYTYISEEVKIPDFRIIMNNDKQILVEVKNYNDDPRNDYTFKDNYFNSLKRYSNLTMTELYIAIYYRKLERFLLVHTDDFEKNDDGYTISISKALVNNRFGDLGDIKLATTAPLELHLKVTGIMSNDHKDYSEFDVTVNDVVIKCMNIEISNDLNKNIAYKLIWHGDWNDERVEYIFDNNKKNLTDIILSYYPTGYKEDEAGEFHSITDLSSLLIKSFHGKTTENKKLKQLSYSGIPLDLNKVIPYNHNSEELPIIWVHTEPN
ncbi:MULTISPECIES: hypothetical protein [Acinetobacter]|uniref:hypothetical protein n=1 Tax=Acinetobacter TaxID=469 RepID=UPI000CFEBB97|nr:hypothetical protein [Acinetobacter sp. MYb10]QLD60625.1 hypothetical protein CQZ96_004780 [Acinetobacter sp. MYb10]